MRKQTALLVLSLLFAGLFTACEKDEMTLPDQALNFRSGDCTIDCILPEGPFFSTDYVQEYQPGSTVTVTAYNTATEMKYEITSSTTIKKVVFNDVIYYASNTPATQPYVITVPLGTYGVDWFACQEQHDVIEVRRTNSSGGGLGVYLNFDITTALIGVCGEEECEGDFSYSTTELGQNYLIVLFTYTSPVDIPDAKVQLTCPHITDLIPQDGKEYTSPGNSKSVYRWTGNIKACEATTFLIKFIPDCEQNNAGFANICTNFNVKGSEKFGEFEKIVFECP